MSTFQRMTRIFALVAFIGVFGGLVAVPDAAAAPVRQSIQFNFTSGSFFSVTGGSSSASAVLQGTLGPGPSDISRLTGTLNLAVRDANLQVSPNGTLTTSTSTQVQPWCAFFDPFTGQCLQQHFMVIQFQSRSVPVDLHFGGSHGSGNLNWTITSCIADCQPGFPQEPQGFGSLFGGLNGSQTAGQLFLQGQVRNT